MSEIFLNAKEIAFINKAMDEGKKSVIINDLLINFRDGKVIVTNAHTGVEMKMLNWNE